MANIVETLTHRAERRGKAVGGRAWEVERRGNVYTLYHYAHPLAHAKPSGDISVQTRPGYALSVSDREGIRSFGSALGLPSNEVRKAVDKQPFKSQAYGVTWTQAHQFPRRRGEPAGPDTDEYARMERAEQTNAVFRQMSGMGQPFHQHAETHSDASHHVGPCNAACRRGKTMHTHRGG